MDCDLNSEFAVICSFLAQFGPLLEINLNIEELEKSIMDQENLDETLVEIHVKLIKKTRRYFVRDQWEKALVKFASKYSYDVATELNTLGYLKSRPSTKLELLHRLFDAQFECDQDFKNAVNLLEAEDLRRKPLGRDIGGNTYWQMTDSEGNFRLFREAPFDGDNSWEQISSNPDALNILMHELESVDDDRLKRAEKEANNDEDDSPCKYCNKPDDPDWILLCDSCDDGYHTDCCVPPLMLIPDGNWYCPPCEHKMLLDSLKNFHTSMVKLRAAKELERMKMQKLRELCELRQFHERHEKRVVSDDEITEVYSGDDGDEDDEYEHDNELDDDDEDDEEDEEEDSDTSIDELVSEFYPRSQKKRSYSYYSDESDESDFEPTRARRATSKMINYEESSDESQY